MKSKSQTKNKEQAFIDAVLDVVELIQSEGELQQEVRKAA